MNYKKTLFFLLLSLLCSFVIFNASFAGNVDQSQITQFESNTPAKASEVNGNFETLRQAINDNNVKTNQANSDINGLTSDISSLNSSVNSLNSNISGLTSHVNNLDSDIDGLSSDIDGLSTDINDINTDINNHKAYSDAHHSRYTDEEAVSAVKSAGIGEVTNNTISTSFTSSFIEQGIPIPDGELSGAKSTITIPDIGIINSINIDVEINTSDISNIDIKLIDPNDNTYILYESNDWATGTLLTAGWPDPNAILDGDITIWIDQNPKGDWQLWVIDNNDDNLENDGEITEWSITIQGVSIDTATINGDLTVNGSIRAEKGGVVITPTKMLISRVKNTIYYTAADGTLHTLVISDQSQPSGNSYIHYYPNCNDNTCRSGSNDTEAVLYFNIEDSPSICCTLLSSEEDFTYKSKGLYWATDGGNNSADAWGNSSTSTFKLSKDGCSDLVPMISPSSYAIICF